jgi:hypothetical protein
MMPDKSVAGHGKRFSPAELEAARRVRLAVWPRTKRTSSWPWGLA